MTRQSPFLGLVLGWVCACHAGADEPEIDPSELPRIPAVEPADALATFELREGFALKLAAHEPQVTDPIAIAFDADGRLYAVEMRDYPERRNEALGRIRLLEDKDEDGVFETATVFARDLKWPTSVTCYDGGIFAVVTPDLLYLKDTDGDGIADRREVVFTGLAEGVPEAKLNMEGLANGLQWGPDNRIWCSSSTSGGKLRPPAPDSRPALDLSRSDFSFDPKTREVRGEKGGGQNGMGFDLYGRRYLTSNSRHLMAVMREASWSGGRDSFSDDAWPDPLVSIAVDGDAAPVFRISPDEPWRIVRTRWRVAGVVGGPVEGGGRVSGYFTGASGVTIYKGDAYGPDFVGNAFVADVGSNLVHRKILRSAGGGRLVALEAVRPEDEQEREFLASRDNWFRPTNFANGPDGCLYVVDMYREVVEHPWSLPEPIKKHLDLYAGMDRGRIYRVEPVGLERRKTPCLSALSSDELVALLAHPNGWHRETAQRLLWERGDARAGSGWARAPEPGSAFARYRQLLSGATLRDVNSDARWADLAPLIGTEPGDPWLDAALLSWITDASDAREAWRETIVKRKAGTSLRVPLAGLVAGSGDLGEIREILRTDSLRDQAVPRLQVACALAGGLSRNGNWNGEARALFDGEGLPALALAVAREDSAEDAARESAIRFAGQLGLAPELPAFLTEGHPEAVRLAALEALRHAEVPGLSGKIVAEWDRMSARLRAAALATLGDIAGGKGTLALLEAIERGSPAPETLPADAVANLRKHASAKVRALAARVLPEANDETKEEILARFAPALGSKGEAARGAVLYDQLCSGCHRAGGKGFAVGPDLESFKGAGRESILTNLIDPNRQVLPSFIAYTLTLKSGEIVAGLLGEESVSALTIRQPFGMKRTIPRQEVAAMESAGLSLMPENLALALTPESMADLLAFIEAR